MQSRADVEGAVMRDRWWLAPLGASLTLALAAPLLAPSSCSGGLAAFFWIGIVLVVAMAVVPFIVQRAAQTWVRVMRAFAGVLACGSVWIALFFVAPFRLMCKLF